MKCSQCNHKQYRKTLCRRCYKKFRKNHFHCTHGTCYKPVFSATLCQFHYRYYQTSCLLCDKKPYETNYLLDWSIKRSFKELIKSESNFTRRHEETLEVTFSISDKSNNTIYTDSIISKGA